MFDYDTMIAHDDDLGAARIMPPPQDFLRHTMYCGQDMSLCQGASGTASFKFKDVMWIKAAGLNLADAWDKPTFVALDYFEARRQIEEAAQQQDITFKTACRASFGTMRPSLETAIHAMLPFKVIFHTHSINALCHCLSPQGRDLIGAKLTNMDMVTVPYARRGLPLLEAIQNSFDKFIPTVFALSNQGLLICSDSVDLYIKKNEDLERGLYLPHQIPFDPLPQQNIADDWAVLDSFKEIAIDPLWRQRFTAGCYTPDQAIFVGRQIPSVTSLDMLDDRNMISVPVRLVADEGIYVHRSISRQGLAVVYALCHIVSRAPQDWDLDRLDDDDVMALITSEQEQYRRKMCFYDEVR